jgi:hypothetical protein
MGRAGFGHLKHAQVCRIFAKSAWNVVDIDVSYNTEDAFYRKEGGWKYFVSLLVSGFGISAVEPVGCSFTF